MQLNPQQSEAIRYCSGHVLVLAGAGSGKTRVITEKIARLVEREGYEPRQIFAVTFTNKAAREMLERIAQKLGGQGTQGLSISTFHTLGLNIIRQEHEALGYKRGFTIFDSADSSAVLRELLRDGDEGFQGDEDAARWQISSLKNDGIWPKEAVARAKTGGELALAKLYARYQRQLLAYNAVDFDDLIIQPVRLFQEDEAARTRWQGRVHHLLVDEYQDTNASQYALIKLLLGHRGRLTAVGDDDQSIYAWRGARPENLHALSEDFPSLKVIKLEQNYRSMARILKCANRVIANNEHLFDKRLWSDLGIGDKIRVLPCKSEEDEAERIVSELVRLKFTFGARDRDFAILYRGNHQSRLFEAALRAHNIPYKVSGGTAFFDRSEIKDLLAYLRLGVNPSDDAAFLRVVNTPRREIGTTTLEKLGSYARQRQVPLLSACEELGLESVLGGPAILRLRRFSDFIRELGHHADLASAGDVIKGLLEDIHYADWLTDTSRDKDQAKAKLANVRELQDWVEKMAQRQREDKGEAFSLNDLVAKITLMDVMDRQSDEGEVDAVNLMTLHASKGLEFPHVFLTGMEENLLPHRNSIEQDTIEEERRLCYVGITRAQRSLCLTYALSRKRGGEVIRTDPSRFLEELPADEILWEGHSQSTPEQKKATAEESLELLRQMLEG
ncbi:MAG: UvrD-helicase domain-containing protein [Pseudomonadota bacterium]